MKSKFTVRQLCACAIVAALYAAVVILNKKITLDDAYRRTTIQLISAAVTLLPYLLLTEGLHMARMTLPGWLCLAAVGLFHTGAMYVVYFSSLQKLRGQEAAILSYIDPLVAVIVSFAVFREPITPLQLVGGALILGCTLLNELRSTRS